MAFSSILSFLHILAEFFETVQPLTSQGIFFIRELILIVFVFFLSFSSFFFLLSLSVRYISSALFCLSRVFYFLL